MPHVPSLNQAKRRGNYVWDNASGLWYNTKTKFYFDAQTKHYNKDPSNTDSWLKIDSKAKNLVPVEHTQPPAFSPPAAPKSPDVAKSNGAGSGSRKDIMVSMKDVRKDTPVPMKSNKVESDAGFYRFLFKKLDQKGIGTISAASMKKFGLRGKIANATLLNILRTVCKNASRFGSICKGSNFDENMFIAVMRAIAYVQQSGQNDENDDVSVETLVELYGTKVLVPVVALAGVRGDPKRFDVSAWNRKVLLSNKKNQSSSLREMPSSAPPRPRRASSPEKKNKRNISKNLFEDAAQDFEKQKSEKAMNEEIRTLKQVHEDKMKETSEKHNKELEIRQNKIEELETRIEALRQSQDKETKRLLEEKRVETESYNNQIQDLKLSQQKLRGDVETHTSALLEARRTHQEELESQRDKMDQLRVDHEAHTSKMTDEMSKLQDKNQNIEQSLSREIVAMREAVQREESSHAELFKRHENHLRSVRDGEQDFKVQIEKSQKEMKEMKDAMTMKHESEISNLLGTFESERDVFREAKLNVRNLEAHLETTEQSSMAKYRSMEKHYARERTEIESNLYDMKQRHEDLRRSSSQAAEQLKRMTSQMSELDSRYESRMEDKSRVFQEKMRHMVETHEGKVTSLSERILELEKLHSDVSAVLKQTRQNHEKSKKKFEANMSASEAQRAEATSAREAERRGSMAVVADLQGALAAEKRENESWTKQLKKLRRNYVILEQQFEVSESRHASVKNEMDEMRKKMSSSSSSSDVLAKNIHASYEDELAEMKTREDHNKVITSKFQVRVNELKADVSRLEDLEKKMRQSHETEKSRASEWASKYSDLEARHIVASKAEARRINELEGTLAELEKALSEPPKAILDLTDRVSMLESHLQKSRQDVNTMTSLLEKERESSKLMLESHRQDAAERAVQAEREKWEAVLQNQRNEIVADHKAALENERKRYKDSLLKLKKEVDASTSQKEGNDDGAFDGSSTEGNGDDFFEIDAFEGEDDRDMDEETFFMDEEAVDENAEKERIERERIENERKEKLEKRIERERIERERLERERLERERLEKEKIEREKLEKERLEKERIEREKREKERLEKERLETDRIERERLEKERLEKERLEKERLEKERLEKERLEKERLEKERLEKERLEKERLEKEILEKEAKKKRKEEKRKRKKEKRKEEKIRQKDEKEKKQPEKAMVAEETNAQKQETPQNRSAPPPIPKKTITSPEERRRLRENIVQAHQKRLQQTIEFLNQGSDMLKYNKGNKNASVKWVGLDKSRKVVGWGPSGKKKFKTKIPLSDITAVFYGVCTPNLLRHIGYTKEPWCCFSFRTKERTYDFVASTGEVATRFVFGIQQLSQSTYRYAYGKLLIRRMRMRLNYVAARNKMTAGKALTCIAQKISRQIETMKKSKTSFVGDELTKLVAAASKKPNYHATVEARPGSLGVKLREAPDRLGGVVLQDFVKDERTGEMGQLEATGKLRVGMFLTRINSENVSTKSFHDVLSILRSLASNTKIFAFDTVRGGNVGKDKDGDDSTSVETVTRQNSSTTTERKRSQEVEKPKEKSRGPKHVVNLVQNPAILREKKCVVAILSGMKPDAMVRAVSEMEEFAEKASRVEEMKNFAFVAAAAEAAPVVKRLRGLTALKPCKDDKKMQILLIDLPGGKNFALYPAPESATESFSGVLEFLGQAKSGKISFEKLGGGGGGEKKTKKIKNTLKMSDAEFETYSAVYEKMDPEGKGQASAAHIKVLLTRTQLKPEQLREAVITSRAMKPAYHPQSCESICRLLRIVAFIQGGGKPTLESINKLGDKPLPLAVVEGVIAPSTPKVDGHTESHSAKNNLKMSDKEYVAYRSVYEKMDPEGKGIAEASHIKILLTRTKLSASKLRDAVITSRAMKPSYHPQSCESICRLLRIVAFVQGGGEATLEAINQLDDKPLPLAAVDGVL